MRPITYRLKDQLGTWASVGAEQESGATWISVGSSAEPTETFMPPEHARELASALLMAADVAEAAPPPGD